MKYCYYFMSIACLSLQPISAWAADCLSTPGFDYYVSPTGNDTNAGTSAAPFATPQRAVDTATAAGAGKRVCFAPGTYALPTTLSLTDSWLLLDESIALIGSTDNATNQPSTIFTHNKTVFRIVADNVTIKNIKTTASAASYTVDIKNSGGTIRNLNIDNVHFTGFDRKSSALKQDSPTSVDGLTVTNSTMENFLQGFYTQKGNSTQLNNATLRNASLENVKFDSVTMRDMGEACIYTEKLSNARISNFVCDGVDDSNANTKRESGIRLNLKAGDFEDITLEKVTVRNVKGTGIIIQPRDDCDKGNLFGSCSGRDYTQHPATLKNLSITESTIENNLGGIRIGLGPYCTTDILTCNATTVEFTKEIKDLVIKRNNIQNNQDTTWSVITWSGLFNGTTAVIDATANYWGDDTGPKAATATAPLPYSPITTPSGSGNSITPRLTYCQWLNQNGQRVGPCRSTPITPASAVAVPTLNQYMILCLSLILLLLVALYNLKRAKL